MAFAVRLIAALLPKDNIIKFLLVLLLIPIMLIVLLISGPMVLAMRVPLVTPLQARFYSEGAKIVSDSTKSPCNSGVIVNWQEVIAIDAVLLKQDFKKSSKGRALDLAKKFIFKTGECSHCVGSGKNAV